MNVLSSPRTRAARLTQDLGQQAKPFTEQLAMAFGVGLPFIGLIAGILLTWGTRPGRINLLLFLALYVFTILGVTIGYHRMFTHRALKAGPVVRFILAMAGSMSAQGSVLEWCAVHREHHKHSDRDGDPHSPHLHSGGWLGTVGGMLHAHFGWLFSHNTEPANPVVADLLSDPVLRFADRFFWLWMLLGWILPATVAALLFRTWSAALGGLIWGGLVRTFALHHVTWSVNSVCHIWGRRTFVTPDQSRNNALLGVLAFGEGWHNNHHAFPTSARHGLRWWQVDFTYWIICGLKVLGLVTQVRTPPPAAIHAKLALGAAAADLTDATGPAVR